MKSKLVVSKVVSSFFLISSVIPDEEKEAFNITLTKIGWEVFHFVEKENLQDFFLTFNLNPLVEDQKKQDSMMNYLNVVKNDQNQVGLAISIRI